MEMFFNICYNYYFSSRIRLRTYDKKKKLVGWYVARCGSMSKREGYINELKVWYHPLPFLFLRENKLIKG